MVNGNSMGKCWGKAVVPGAVSARARTVRTDALAGRIPTSFISTLKTPV